jgi:hypothetical protein
MRQGGRGGGLLPEALPAIVRVVAGMVFLSIALPSRY